MGFNISLEENHDFWCMKLRISNEDMKDKLPQQESSMEKYKTF